jgi:hypothetical protein
MKCNHIIASGIQLMEYFFQNTIGFWLVWVFGVVRSVILYCHKH